jgi:hypothetical protein
VAVVVGLAGSLADVDHVLATHRLVLRPVTPADHAPLLAHWRARRCGGSCSTGRCCPWRMSPR